MAEGRDTKGRFSFGNSGRPKGARAKATIACEALLDGQVEQLTQKAIQMALAGDPVAMRLCMDRLAPPRRDRHVNFKMPKLAGAEDHPSALAAIMKAVAASEITPAEGQAMAAMLAEHRKAVEAAEFETRLAALEEASGK